MEKTSLDKNHQNPESGEQIQMKADNSLQPPQFKLDASGNGGGGSDGGSGGGLSPELNSQMSSAMGHDFSNVNIHANSSKASDVGALAYAQGNDVHFAPGQFKPDTQSGQELIGHELAHVAQQREGRVQANNSVGGMPVNDDKSLESEADSMGAKAAQMKPGPDFAGGNSGSSGSSSSAPAQKKDDPLKVKEGQVTFDAEGQDSGRYFSRVLHWPGGNSGVTIGRGYDLGSRTAKEVIGHCTAAGIPESQSSLLSGGAGLKGEPAGEWVTKNKAKFGEISHDQQKVLFEVVYGEMKQSVVNISEKKAAKDKYGDVDFEKLHPAIMEMLVDLRYRGDYTPKSREWIQPLVVKNDLKGFAAAISDKKWMNDYGVPKGRYDARKAFMDAALAGKTPAQKPSESAPAGKDEPKKETTAPTSGNGNNSTTAIDSGTVNASSLNVRSGPGPSFGKVGNPLTDGTKVQVYEKKDGWLRIGNGQWVSADYVKLTGKATEGPATKPAADPKPTAEGTVTASQLNVRATPSADGKVVDTLKSGTKVTILAESDGWMQIGPGRWVSGKFVQKTGAAPTQSGPTTAGGGAGAGTGGGKLEKPSWISVAEGELGVKEIEGAKHNPRVIEYHATTGKFKDDETPWCSSFANWVMLQAGQQRTGSALALSWANYGKKLSKPAYGSIAVFKHANGTGHVGFVVGVDKGRIQVLGGNQSNMVKISSMGTSEVVAYVVPKDWEVPQANYTMGKIEKVDELNGTAATR
ncbi:MAG: TIGR02594 family protein [Bacteroidia bacterium]